MNLEEERDALRRELAATTEMLAHVLYAVGEPVVVTEAALTRGLPNNAQIAIDNNVKDNAFVFSVIEVDE